MKRKAITSVAVLMAALISAAGCTISVNGRSVSVSTPFSKSVSTGIDTTITYNLSRSFSEIEAAGLYKIVYTDSVDVVEVTCDKGLVPYLVIRHEDNGRELSFGTKSLSLRDAERILVRIPLSCGGLESVELSGACSFESESVLSGAKLDVDMSGASRFEAEVAVRDLDLDMSGACRVTLSGSADRVEADGSGACNLSCRNLRAGNVSLEMSGATKGEFNAGFLDAELSGASKICVNEDAETRISASGASKIERY
ncbi:MAG: DUF2807 domain-containing protein [Bacteroidales bacterium]|nr:DUF2807 domain-containing protein [Bacteroidales bacterium]